MANVVYREDNSYKSIINYEKNHFWYRNNGVTFRAFRKHLTFHYFFHRSSGASFINHAMSLHSINAFAFLHHYQVLTNTVDSPPIRGASECQWFGMDSRLSMWWHTKWPSRWRYSQHTSAEQTPIKLRPPSDHLDLKKIGLCQEWAFCALKQGRFDFSCKSNKWSDAGTSVCCLPRKYHNSTKHTSNYGVLRKQCV